MLTVVTGIRRTDGKTQADGFSYCPFSDHLPPERQEEPTYSPWTAQLRLKRCSSYRKWLKLEAFNNSTSCPHCAGRFKRAPEDEDEGGGDGRAAWEGGEIYQGVGIQWVSLHRGRGLYS